MPNWVSNSVHLKGSKEDLDNLRKSVNKEEESKVMDLTSLVNGDDPVKATETIVEHHEFNFDSIIPMPEELKGTTSNGTVRPELEKKYGHSDWYHWCIHNWGTKWNACDVKWHDDTHVTFDTAWAAPFEIFEALSEQHPNVEMHIKYADEDIGYNCGEIVLHNEKGACVHDDYTEYPNNYHRKKDVLIECKSYLIHDYDFEKDEWINND
jgi:hypothetical protein